MQIKVSESSNHLEKGSLVYFFEPQSVAVISPMRESLFGSHALIKLFRGWLQRKNLSS